MEKKVEKRGSNFLVYDQGEYVGSEFVLEEDEQEWISSIEEEGFEVRKA